MQNVCASLHSGNVLHSIDETIDQLLWYADGNVLHCKQKPFLSCSEMGEKNVIAWTGVPQVPRCPLN